MPSDSDYYRTIKSQTLSIIQQITAEPKPSYSLDGQTVSWNEYLSRLRATVDWCDERIQGEEPFEFRTQASS